MSKRIFPGFVYTREFASALLVALLWLNFKALDVFHGMARLPFVAFTTISVLFLGRELLRGKDFLKEPLPPPPRRPYRYRAYLVAHISFRQTPPTVTFVGIYSSSASDLTNCGSEAHADLYSVEAASYHDASEDMEQVARLYFPWVVPLMKRYR